MTDPTPNTGRRRITVSVDPDLREIIPGFLSNRHNDVTALRAALHAGEFKTVRLVGHRLKGDGGSYGFEDISAIGDALEQAAIHEDRSVIATQIDRLQDFLARVDVVY
jgi:HPt (histidine-containing phosphotransfer) domain-containing protein